MGKRDGIGNFWPPTEKAAQPKSFLTVDLSMCLSSPESLDADLLRYNSPPPAQGVTLLAYNKEILPVGPFFALGKIVEILTQ